MSYNSTTLVWELNRLAQGGTLTNTSSAAMLDETGAANKWAGTTGLGMLAALNAKAGNSRSYAAKSLNGVCNQLAGTTGLQARDALAQVVS